MARKINLKAALEASTATTSLVAGESANLTVAKAIDAAKSFDAALLGVLEAATSEGRAASATLDAVRAAFAFSHDDEHVAKVRDEFYTGRMMAKCGHEESAARVAICKKPFNFLPNVTNSDLNRTAPEQRCINASRVRFSELLHECGIETARTGAGGAPTTRVPRPEGNAKKTPIAAGSSQAPLALGAVVVPKAHNPTEVIETSRRIEAILGTFLNDSSAAFTGDIGAMVRDALVSCRAALGKAIKLSSDPRLTQIEALKAQLAALNA